MLKRLSLTLALAANLAIPAHAADTTEDCMKQAFQLAELAEEKQLPDGALDKLDGMFNELETYCKALQFPKAQAQAAKIKAFIETEK
jgi:hypothetical protein